MIYINWLFPPSNDLQTIEKLPIQYFGRVQTDSEDFVLISIDPLKTDFLDKLIFPRRKLATAIEGQTFFWIYPNPGKPLPASLLSMALVRDREGILVRISPEDAEGWAAEGYSIRLLVSLPILSPSIAPKTLRGVKGEGAVSPKPGIQEMMDQVTEDVVYNYTGDLTGVWPVTIGGTPYTIATRNSYRTEEIQKAGQYLYEFYNKLGLEVSFEEFSYRDTSQRNRRGNAGSGNPGRVSACREYLFFDLSTLVNAGLVAQERMSLKKSSGGDQ